MKRIFKLLIFILTLGISLLITPQTFHEAPEIQHIFIEQAEIDTNTTPNGYLLVDDVFGDEITTYNNRNKINFSSNVSLASNEYEHDEVLLATEKILISCSNYNLEKTLNKTQQIRAP